MTQMGNPGGPMGGSTSQTGSPGIPGVSPATPLVSSATPGMSPTLVGPSSGAAGQAGSPAGLTGSLAGQSGSLAGQNGSLTGQVVSPAWGATRETFDVLREITATHTAVLEVIERAFDEARGVPDLDLLRSQVAVVLDRLRQRVAEKTTVPAESLLLPLVCLYDERVMVRAMEPRGEEHWSRLQRVDYAPREDGGDLFFQKERDLLARAGRIGEGADAAERQEVILLVTLYRFCLAEGFQGRCSEAPERLEDRIRQLDGALESLVPPRPAAPKKAAAPAHRPSWIDRLRRALQRG